MSEKHLVCQGAICRCNFGTSPNTMKVLTQSKRYINDKEGEKKLMATHQDLGKTFEKNTFGSCAKMNNNPCQVVVTEWSGYYKKITLEDNSGKALLESSKATCPVGGKDCISIIDHGQQSELSRQNLSNTSPEALAELCPFFDFFAEENENENNENYVTL